MRIFDDVCGIVWVGEMLVIMGLSGLGKIMLFNVLVYWVVVVGVIMIGDVMVNGVVVMR